MKLFYKQNNCKTKYTNSIESIENHSQLIDIFPNHIFTKFIVQK